MPNIKRPKVYKGSELPSTGKMSAIKTDLKRVPSKSVGSPKSSGIKTPKIEISGTNVGGGKFTRSANRSFSTSPKHESFHGIKTTSNKAKKINYNLEPTNAGKSLPDTSQPKIPQKWHGKTQPTKSKNNYGG